ncbi:MAG: sulfatase-like hydrolase/transferase, partial [Bacteroidales bacterium]|nr:sulfatase-like hydrolase/transferase [Bacteroidales bacterium]
MNKINFSRRSSFQSILLLIITGVALTSCEKSGQTIPERPNILFAFADDWGKYAGCYAEAEGSPGWQKLIKTPNIDRVAREGILFNNAYVNSPSCTPCRSSILSGQYF